MIAITPKAPDCWGNPPSVHFVNGPLDFVFEQGRIRYLCFEGREVIRMVHVAVRDEHWMTADSTINDFTFAEESGTITISYEQRFIYSTIDFVADIKIKCSPRGLSFSFSGKALKDFLSNRTGICVLHPINNSAGQACLITHDNGSTSQGNFPETISAHQPLLDIRAMVYNTSDAIKVEVVFSGDIFETEDQRNWGDYSFKTYGTPLSNPFPVMIRPGNRINQSADFHFQAIDPLVKTVQATVQKKLFSKMPALGFSLPLKESLTTTVIDHILLLNPGFLQIAVEFDDGWRERLIEVLQEQRLSTMKLQFVIYFSENKNDLIAFSELIKDYGCKVQSLILADPSNPVTTQQHWDQFVSFFRVHLPDTPAGTGTSHHFAELNRHQIPSGPMKFLSFPVNPQVHASDQLTILENLQAFPDLVTNAQKLNPGLPVVVSRLTFRYPKDPDPANSGRYQRRDGLSWTVDDRQWSLFYGVWLLLASGYLADAEQICSCDTHGFHGLMSHTRPPGYENPPQEFYLSPAFLIQAEINCFGPLEIARIPAENPLQTDGVLYKNHRDEYLMVLVNFSPVLTQVRRDDSLPGIRFWEMKNISGVNLIQAVSHASQWIGGAYSAYEPADPDLFILQPCTCHFYRSIMIF